MSAAGAAPRTTTGRLRELALLFLRLGGTAFGGPAAHLGMIQDEVVRRRRWLSPDEFLDLVGATNLIPGPNSTELAIHIGHRRAGTAGLLVAGACFILPAVACVWMLAWVYARYGRLPAGAHLLYGVKPVIIAVVLQALWTLRRGALKSRGLAVTAVVAVALCLAGVHELVVLFGAGVAVAAARALAARRLPPTMSLWPALPPLSVAAAALAGQPFHLAGLFLVFLKVGAVLFGSGYVLLALLRAELVVRLGWLTNGQLLDAIAVGQITPGPLFSTATFIGYQLGGHAGAAVATVGIFLPAFVFVAISGPLVPRLRRSATAAAFLDGVNAASLALMAVVTGQLAKDAVHDVPTVLLAAASAVLLWRFRVGSGWLALGGALFGVIWGMIR